MWMTNTCVSSANGPAKKRTLLVGYSSRNKSARLSTKRASVNHARSKTYPGKQPDAVVLGDACRVLSCSEWRDQVRARNRSCLTPTD
jgi:hypothetical protein